MHGVARVRTHVVGALLAFLLLAPAAASAQSAFSGIVRDTSGAVLPGVTVEATSPVLIEKTRAAVTDGEGRYSIVDLRPGTYLVVFTLTGFNTLRREGLELPANFTMTINADLRVGSLEESITVTGDAPVVDVQSTQRTQVLNREMLDALPTARNYSGLAALMPGVRMSNTDVGGNQQMEQIYMTVHGSRQTDVTVQVDGLQMNSLMNDGQVQAYFSDAGNAEVTYQTSGVGAEVSGGGVRINMIPKEGGNRFSGSAFAGGTNGSWQSNNVTDELKAKGLVSGDRVDHISDYNYGIGGPIMQDRLWYFHTFRRIATNEVVANNFYEDGRPGIEDQWIYNIMLRMTWQMTQKNKLTAYYDRYPKFKGHEMGPLTDPDTAASRRDWIHAIYYTGSAKFTSTVTSRLLLEAGYSTNMEYLYIGYQPGVQKDRGSSAWFNTIGKEELVGFGTVTPFRYWDGLFFPTFGIDPKKYVISTSASYVTGSHNFKAGFQWGFGSYVLERDVNGDLVQLYRNGRPDSVRVHNTPVRSEEFLNGDIGIYAQDSWTVRRLTVNAGVRLERFEGQISDQDVAPGRFAPSRHFDKTPCMPCWFDIAPRFGVSYDLFGNARTAIKGTLNRFMAGQTLSFAQRYNPLQIQQDTRTWNDANGDDVAQENEIGPSNNVRFGEPVFTRRPDPDIAREYDMGVQRGDPARARPQPFRVGRLVPPQHLQHDAEHQWAVYACRLQRRQRGQPARRVDHPGVQPGSGEARPHRSRRCEFDRHVAAELRVTTGSSLGRRRASDGRRCSEDGRSIAGSSITATSSRTGATWLASSIPPRESTRRSPSPITITAIRAIWASPSSMSSSCRARTCCRGTFRSTPRCRAIQGVTCRHAGASVRRPGYAPGCPGPCTPGALVIPNMTAAVYNLDLTPPGSDFYERMTQVDLGFRKLFRVGTYQFSGQADIFNATNSSYVKNQNTTLGASFGQPLETLQPRTLRLAVQMRF